MLQHIRPALVSLGFFTLLTGAAYPLAITGIAQAVMPEQANGSLVIQNGKAVGSALIGQPFSGDTYFHPRPSAAGDGYNAAASSGSNLGPTSAKLADRMKADAATIRQTVPEGALPADMITASGSGLDPHISLENARLQLPRVAAARGWTNAQVAEILAVHEKHKLLSKPYVNVLLLNIALDNHRIP